MLDVILTTWIISYLECYCLENIMLTLSAYSTIFLLAYDTKCALKFMPFLRDCQAVAVYLLMLWALVAVPDKLLIIHAFCGFCLLVMSDKFSGLQGDLDREAGWRVERCVGDQKSDCRRPPPVAVVWWSDCLTRARKPACKAGDPQHGETRNQTLEIF